MLEAESKMQTSQREFEDKNLVKKIITSEE
jgi:hypothetical protein